MLNYRDPLVYIQLSIYLYIQDHTLNKLNEMRKTTKKLIERNLKFSNKYIYKSITRGSIESGQVCLCDNCGKLITNMVHIFDNSNNKNYTIGIDCAETLSKANSVFNNINSDFRLDIYSFNLTSKFVTEINKGKKYIDNGFNLSIENDKGKILNIFKNDLIKFYPEHLNK